MKKRKAPRAQVVVNPLWLMSKTTQAEKDRIIGRFTSALREMVAGRHPGAEEWKDLSDCCNTIETMATELGMLDPAEVMPIVNAAVESMGNAGRRHREGKGMRLDGPGVTALGELIDIYAQCLDGYTKREMAHAQAATEKRIRELLRQRNPSAELIAV